MYKHITVLFVIHLCFQLNLCFEWNKCCEPSNNLIKIKVNGTWKYKCSNITENNIPLTVVNFKNNTGIPENCTDDLMCIDKLIDPRKINGVIIALSCETKRIPYNPDLPTINKCCPDGMYYNRKFKVCERDESSTIDQLHDTVADAYNLNYGFPICNRRVFMEKEFENIFVNLENGTLQITLEGDLMETFENGTLQGTFEENLMETFENGTLQKKLETFEKGTYCIDTRKTDNTLSGIVVFCIPLGSNVKEFCTESTCVPKCCPFGHIYVNGTVKRFECVPEWDIPFDPRFNNEATGAPDYFSIMDKPICREGKYLKPNYYLFKNGTLRISEMYFYDSFVSRYCLEKFNTDSEYTAVICFSNKVKDFWKTFIFLTGTIISILFLGVTLIIYFFLPELQNLHGRTVMSHTTSLLAAYICLSFVKQAKTNYGGHTCKILGYGLMLTFLSAFTWLNVMCFDIWWTFGVVKARGLTRNKDLKKFLYYCIYAHGLPLIITSIAITVEMHPDVPKIYKPKIGQYTCWFNLEKGVPVEYTIFFIVPVAILIICNITLFVLTTRHCLKIRRDIQRMQHNDSPQKKRFLADRETLLMNVKLFIVMGITWSFELISAYVRKPAELWLFLDAINVLQGLWIFFIFVFKDNVWKAIKKKLGYSTIQEGSTQTTLSTKMSIASNTSLKMNGLKQEEKILLQSIANRNREKNDD